MLLRVEKSNNIALPSIYWEWEQSGQGLALGQPPPPFAWECLSARQVAKPLLGAACDRSPVQGAGDPDGIHTSACPQAAHSGFKQWDKVASLEQGLEEGLEGGPWCRSGWLCRLVGGNSP